MGKIWGRRGEVLDKVSCDAASGKNPDIRWRWNMMGRGEQITKVNVMVEILPGLVGECECCKLLPSLFFGQKENEVSAFPSPLQLQPIFFDNVIL